MNDFLILITTYKREHMFCDLLRSINKEKGKYKIKVIAVNDGSNYNLNFIPAYDFIYFKNPENFGKKGYWKTINFLYKKASLEKYKYVIQLPDDVLLCPDFFSKVSAHFESIRSRKKSALNILLDENRAGTSQWTNKPIKSFKNEWSTGWIDMCFISENILHSLDFYIHPIDSKRWDRNKLLGSGVGAQISKRIVDLKLELFQTKINYVFHGNHNSVMNYDARKIYPLIAK